MASENNYSRGAWEVAFGRAPRTGSKAMLIELDFAQQNPIDINLVFDQQSLKLEFVQAIYVDNSDNPSQLVCDFRNTQQVEIIPPGWQGYIPVLASPDNAVVVFTSTLVGESLVVPVQLLNFPVPACLWPANGSSNCGSIGADYSANAPTLLAELIATIPVNAQRQYFEVQNQCATQIQVVMDDGAGGNVSIVLLEAGSGANTQGGSYSSQFHKGRVRVFATNSTDQAEVREH